MPCTNAPSWVSVRGVSRGLGLSPHCTSQWHLCPWVGSSQKGRHEGTEQAQTLLLKLDCPSRAVCGSSAPGQGASRVDCGTSHEWTVLSVIVHSSVFEETGSCLSAQLSCNVQFLSRYLAMLSVCSSCLDQSTVCIALGLEAALFPPIVGPPGIPWGLLTVLFGSWSETKGRGKACEGLKLREGCPDEKGSKALFPQVPCVCSQRLLSRRREAVSEETRALWALGGCLACVLFGRRRC